MTLASSNSPRRLAVLAAAFLACAGRATAADNADRTAIDFFERRIRPVLVERCYECHAGETHEGELRLDSRQGMLAGGGRGAAILPGDARRSLLINAVRRTGKLKMPPAQPLQPEEVAALEAWIQSGAVWPEPNPQDAAQTAATDRWERIRRLRSEHWAFQSIQKPAVPVVEDDWPRNPIDQFILARQREHGLSPAIEADRRVLIRRLYFDLIGLPPSASEVEAFLTDSSPQAYEALVDELLDRPEYGQRWARHWLDVARYADTTGYQEGGERLYPFAWTYRDYVVRSLNDDTPFNQFLVEQLAADQLELAEPQKWKLAAMGFLTLGPRFNYVRHDIIDDRIDVVTRGLLGLTVACARCHDHKYDPVLADDYYGIYGVLASSQEPLYTDLPRIGASRGDFGRYREFRERAATATRKFEQFHARTHRRVLHEMRSQVADYLRYLVQQMPAHRTESQPTFETERGRIRGPTPYGPGGIVRWQNYIAARDVDDPVFGLWRRLAPLSADEVAQRAVALRDDAQSMNPILRQMLAADPPRSMLDVASLYGEVLERIYAQWSDYLESHPEAQALPDPAAEQLRQVLYADDSPIAMNVEEAHDCYSDGEFNRFMGLKRELDSLFVEYQDVAAPRAMLLVDRAEMEEPRVFTRGNATSPGETVPRRFLRMFADIDGGEPFTAGSGRLQWAQAIAHPQNPLTARVIVNRIWGWHFGRGLVDTASDFGTRAAPPSHPQLLDWLAADFMEQGWSLKRLHKLIVLSATYRQASVASIDARQADPENRLLSHMNCRRLGFEALRDALLATAGRLDLTAGGPPVHEISSPRRSLYLFVNRDDLPGVRSTFDFPSPDISADARAETTSPQQALFFMNSGFVAGCVESLLEQMPERTGKAAPSERIEWLYRHVLSRAPSAREAALAASFENFAGAAQGGAAEDHTAWRDLAHVLLMSNEFLFVD